MLGRAGYLPFQALSHYCEIGDQSGGILKALTKLLLFYKIYYYIYTIIEKRYRNDFIEIYLNFGSHVLNLLHKTVQRLEGNTITVLDIFDMMGNLKRELVLRKTDNFFGFETGRKMRQIKKGQRIEQ